MPNREQRRNSENAKSLGRWLHVEDADGNPYDIYLKDVSGKDEYDFDQMMPGYSGGLCDIFLEGKVTLVGIAGLIWSQRRRYEKKLTIRDVLSTVNMMTIESMELHDPNEEDEVEPGADPTRGQPGSVVNFGPSSPASDSPTG